MTPADLPPDTTGTIPTLEPWSGDPAMPPGDITPGHLAELAETLHTALNRELDQAIDGAVYERLRSAMEDVATGIKEQVRAQIEAMLPGLIEAVIRHDRAQR